MISTVKNFILLCSMAFLLLGNSFSTLGQEHPSSVEISPIPELIDVWDADKVRARKPLLIAHRGGVVGKGSPECSQMAIKLAAANKYDMIELDVWETKDHIPVVFHDRNMKEACGVDGEIKDFTFEAVTKIGFLDGDETINSLDAMLALCRSLNFGIMFDIKSREGSDQFFNHVIELIDKHDLDRACITIGGPRAEKLLKGKVLTKLSDEMLDKVKKGESPDLHGYFWFGMPTNWQIELVKPVQECGALVIPAFNTFRYSPENYRAEIKVEANQFIEAGADAFQIDCIYQDYFGREKIYMEK